MPVSFDDFNAAHYCLSGFHALFLVLQSHLSSTKTAVKLGAIRTLSKLAVKHSVIVAACNVDMEALISDSNRSVATFAITTLLKVVAYSTCFLLLIAFRGRRAQRLVLIVS